MSDTKTADDLVYEVASLLGKGVVGETLGSVEYQTIDGKIDGVLARIRKIIYIGDRDEIPIEYYDNIASLVAQFAGAKFANANPNFDAIKGLESDLRYLVAADPSYQVQKTVYY
jgi:hypothetical protein